MQSLVTAMLTGATGVDYEYDLGNGPENRPTNAQVRGSGTPDADVPTVATATCRDEGPLTIIDAGSLEVALTRVVGTVLDADATLAVTWKNGTDVVIAGVR